MGFFIPMSHTIQRVETYLKWRAQSTWRLLAADQAPLILGLLQTALFEQERTLPSSVFHERIHCALEELRSCGHEMPQSAQNYVNNWLSAGFIERTFPANAAEEIYELTAASIEAIRFIEKLVNKRQIATESRLSLVIEQLVHLCEQTDSNTDKRVARLEKEQQRIQVDIRKIKQSGKSAVLSDEQALERTREIIGLSSELVDDFRQVRDKFYQLNRQFREALITDTEQRGVVLRGIFAGIDVIAESDAGRSFNAFWRLLTDPQQSAELEESTETLLSRSFVKRLNYPDRCFLADLTGVLLNRGRAVHAVLQNFARSLKSYVQSREFQEQRRLLTLIKETQRCAIEIKDRVSPVEAILPHFRLTSCKIASCAQLALHDPALFHVNTPIERVENATLSVEWLRQLIAESEIDFNTLKWHILTLLENKEQVSIADVLEHYPAEQGLGSIVGYLSLGVRYGVISTMTEKVSWLDKRAKIPRIYFTKAASNALREN